MMATLMLMLMLLWIDLRALKRGLLLPLKVGLLFVAVESCV